MRIDFELTPTVFADYAVVHARGGPGGSPPSWLGKAQEWMIRRANRHGPFSQAIELSDDGVTDLVRADGQPAFFPWDAVREVWVAATWVAFRLDAPEGSEVEALVVPHQALPADAEAWKARIPALASVRWVDVS